MIPREILKKVRQIQVRTTRHVNDVLSGEYESVFKGRGIAFDEVREYQPGDEVKTIDWNVTARMGRPFVKKFVEERELTILFAVDLSASGIFGSQRRTKNELAAELCAVLAFSAVKNNDKVGLLIFTGRVEKYIPPKKGKQHVLRVIREVLCHTPADPKTDFNAAFDFIGKVAKRRTVTFLISDFIAEGFERLLRVTAKRHDLIGVCLQDPREAELPDVGLVRFFDSESGRERLIDTSDRTTREQHRANFLRREDVRGKLLASCGVDQILVRTDRPYVEAFQKFFKKRMRRKNRR